MKQLISEKNTEKTINIAVLIFAPVILFALMERMYINSSILFRMSFAMMSINILFWFLLLVFLLFVFGKLKTALRIQTSIMMLIGLLNHYLMAFRGTPFQPWDIFSIRTALSVADNYNFSLSIDTITIIVLYILIICASSVLRLRIDFRLKHYYFIRSSFSIISLSAIVLLSAFIQRNSIPQITGFIDWLFYQDEMTQRNGTAASFIYNLQFSSVKIPSGYTKDHAEKLLSDAITQESEGTLANNRNPQRPDIIVVMNEAFSDLRLLGELPTNEEVMPFTDMVMVGIPNTISGYMEVPVLGGNTANTEFEFLTGNSMKFLPKGSVPYQQYIKSPTDTLTSVLKKNGYDTVAIHPYEAKGWERDKIYELFGFDSFITETDFDDPKILRDYISDESDYDKLIEIYESKSSNPLFLFNITMQNHASYATKYENFVPEVKCDGINDDELDCYLSLIRESDAATEQLYSHLKETDNPIIFVFFGDHQPADPVIDKYCEHNGIDISSLRDKRYLVPFYIWTNYNIQTETNVFTTPNVLQTKIIELAGIEPNGYQAFIEQYSKGNFTDEDYSIVQYYEMLEKK